MSPRTEVTPDELRDLLGRVPRGQFIEGEWHESVDAFDVDNPSTGQTLASVAKASEEHVRAAVKAAVGAQRTWARTPARERAELLRSLFDEVVRRSDDFAALISAEMGKPLAEAYAEVTYGAEFLRWFSEEACRPQGNYGSSPEGGLRIVERRIPVGPVLAITPWNFPLAMATRKLAPAFAAGCTVVLKPAELAPLTSLLLMDACAAVGIPAGVVNCVTTDEPEVVVEAARETGGIRKLTFTGSTAVGQHLLRESAAQLWRASLELGGNAPFVVLPHAEMSVAVDAAVTAKLRNGGQACTSANRFLVHHSQAEEFAWALAARFRELTLADALRAECQLGPMISRQAREGALAKLERELAGGAVILAGGRGVDPGYFLEPAVLLNPDPTLPLMCEETFAPIAPVFAYSSVDQAVAMANGTQSGLLSYVMGEHLAHTLQVAEAMDSGMVAINSGVISNAAAPFGGTKFSGVGREGGRVGIDEYTEVQYLGIGVTP